MTGVFMGETVTPPSSQTRTEVRSPTRTATEVRSPTSTSTEAYTQGNFTATVTGGAGTGPTTVHIHAPPLNRANTASSKGPRKNAQENENVNAPRPDERNSSGSGVSGVTPAQAYGHPDFVTDVPVQGPTDEELRGADCFWTQKILPARPACADCEGPIPMHEQISLGGVRARGFGIAAAGDPDVFMELRQPQKDWSLATLAKLDELIVKQTGTRCEPGLTGIFPRTKCFQVWFNENMKGLTGADGKPVVLRTDGTFDQQTLDALRTAVALHPTDFPTPFPGTEMPGIVEEKKLSTGAMVGIAAAGATVIGGGIYLATRKKKRSRR